MGTHLCIYKPPIIAYDTTKFIFAYLCIADCYPFGDRYMFVNYIKTYFCCPWWPCTRPERHSVKVQLMWRWMDVSRSIGPLCVKSKSLHYFFFFLIQLRAGGLCADAPILSESFFIHLFIAPSILQCHEPRTRSDRTVFPRAKQSVSPFIKTAIIPLERSAIPTANFFFFLPSLSPSYLYAVIATLFLITFLACLQIFFFFFSGTFTFTNIIKPLG